MPRTERPRHRAWRPWPAYEADERMRRRALEIVEQMTSGDERLREVFARECVTGAAREWEQLHADALYRERRLGDHARKRR